jgi:hypothetical protein
MSIIRERLGALWFGGACSHGPRSGAQAHVGHPWWRRGGQVADSAKQPRPDISPSVFSPLPSVFSADANFTEVNLSYGS